MLYSRSAKYAVLALAEISLCSSEVPISTKRIADAASVPYPLLAKIVSQLRSAGLIHTARGMSGGIRLERPAAEITIKDVVQAIDGPDILADCPLSIAPCHCAQGCGLHPLWKPARDAVGTFIETMTLKEVSDWRQNVKDRCTR